MARLEELMKGLRTLLLRATEVLALFIAFVALVFVLLGEASGPFVIGVVGNLTLFIAAVSPQTLIAIALVLCLYIALKSRAPKP